VPIYICAALYIVMASVAAAFPFEPMGRRSSWFRPWILGRKMWDGKSG
jgi:hypothetical protein